MYRARVGEFVIYGGVLVSIGWMLTVCVVIDECPFRYFDSVRCKVIITFEYYTMVIYTLEYTFSMSLSHIIHLCQVKFQLHKAKEWLIGLRYGM